MYEITTKDFKQIFELYNTLEDLRKRGMLERTMSHQTLELYDIILRSSDRHHKRIESVKKSKQLHKQA